MVRNFLAYLQGLRRHRRFLHLLEPLGNGGGSNYRCIAPSHIAVERERRGKAYLADGSTLQWDHQRLLDPVRQLNATRCNALLSWEKVSKSRKEFVSSLAAGHMGIKKILGRVNERFYWVCCSKYVCTFSKNCDTCSSRWWPVRKQWALFGRLAHDGALMECSVINVLDPLLLSVVGNRNLLTAADYHIKWMEAYPLPIIRKLNSGRSSGE